METAPMLGTRIPASSDLPKLKILYVIIRSLSLPFLTKQGLFHFSSMKYLHVSNVLSCPRALVSHLATLVFPSFSSEKGGVELNSAPEASVC